MGVKVNKKKLTGKQLFQKQEQMFKDADGAMDNYEKKEKVEVDENAFDENEELPEF